MGLAHQLANEGITGVERGSEVTRQGAKKDFAGGRTGALYDVLQLGEILFEPLFALGERGDRRFLFRGETFPEQGFLDNRRQQFQILAVHVFHDVIAGPQFHGFDGDFFVSGTGHHNHQWRILLGAQILDDVESGTTRQGVVDQQDIERKLTVQGEPLFPVQGEGDGIPLFLKRFCRRRPRPRSSSI